MESGSILLSPVSSYPVISPGWSWPVPFAGYQTHLDARDLKALIGGFELEISRPWESTLGRIVLTLGSRARKCADQKKSTPSPSPTCQTLLLMTSYLTLTSLQHSLTLQEALVLGGQNEPCFHFLSRFLLGPAQPFLSEFPEPAAALLCHRIHPRRTPGKLRRAAVSGESCCCSRKTGTHMEMSSYCNKLHYRAMGSAILIPAFGWGLSAAFELS